MTSDSERAGELDHQAEEHLDRIETERVLALGKLTEKASWMEDALRDAFCSLVGSKYAAVVAGGQGVSWLIEQCKALVKVHHEIPAESKAEITAALERCRKANDRRNELIHGVKTYVLAPDSVMATIRSRKNKHTRDRTKWSLDQLHEAWGDLMEGTQDLWDAMSRAVSTEAMDLGLALIREDWEREGTT